MAQTDRVKFDSDDPWKYVILLGKFMLLVVDAGMAQSFGVLIHEMVERFDSDYREIAFICSLHALMYVTAPVGNVLLKVMTTRSLGLVGGLLSALPLAFVPLANTVFVLGILIATTGVGMVMSLFANYVAFAEFFPKSFIFAATFTRFGATCGVFSVPLIIDRSLVAYGYEGAFLILSGICLHTVVFGAIIRSPRDHISLHDGTKESDKGECTTQDEHACHDEHTPEYPLNDELTLSDQGQRNDPHEISSSGTRNKGQLCLKFKESCQSLPSLRECLKSFILVEEPLCALVIPAVLLSYYVYFSWLLFLVPHAMAFGIDRSTAVFLSTIGGISGIFGRILYLVLLHFKFDPILLLTLSCFVTALSFLMDMVSSAFIFLGIMACVQGFFLLVLESLSTALIKVAVYKGENMPSVISFFYVLEAIGATTGDTLSGHLYDVTSSMTTVFLSFGVALVIVLVNLVVFIIVVRFKEPSQSS